MVSNSLLRFPQTLKLRIQCTVDGFIPTLFQTSSHLHPPVEYSTFTQTGKKLKQHTGEIIHATLNAPGSWHDSRVTRPLYETLGEKLPAGYYMVSDSAFPQGASRCPGKIRAPLTAGSALPDDPDKLNQLFAFNRELLSFWQSAEWGMRLLQGAFGRLRVPLPIKDLPFRQDLLEICVWCQEYG